jgi:transcriptional regulator with XRE-family HTH domain
VDFGKEVRRRREAAKLSVEKLAEAASLSPNFLRAVELGRSEPSLSSFIAICRALKVTPAEMLPGAVKGLGPVGLEAGQLVEAAPADVQDAVLRLLRATRRRR